MLGSAISALVVGGSQAAIVHRMNCAWKAWFANTSQQCDRTAPIRLRAQLLDTLVGASLLWAREALNLTTKPRSTLTAFQRTLICRMSLVCRRTDETAVEYLRRRERIASMIITKHGRAKWGALRTNRAMNFVGHVCRMNPVEHPAAGVHRWRDVSWWEIYQSGLPAKSRVQRCRRPALKGIPCK